jgi:hypothetical protein
MDIIKITAPTPIIIPSIVKKLLARLAKRALSDTLTEVKIGKTILF